MLTSGFGGMVVRYLASVVKKTTTVDQIDSDRLFVPTKFLPELFHERQCLLLHTIVSGF